MCDMKDYDYVAENERILNKWCKKYVEENQPLYPRCPNLDEYFAKDGIMFMGEIVDEPKVYPNGEHTFRWKRKESGMENELWSKAPLRILYLTKDQNTGNDVAWDVRSESFRYADEKYKPADMWLDTTVTFFRNLVYSLYGIGNTTAERTAIDFTNEKALEYADKHIFARINCKKEVGGATCSNAILKKAIERDDKYLKQQIDNLDADILICCGYSQSIEKTGSLILNFLNDNGYNFQQEIDEWIYYDKEKNKIAINSWHLSDFRRFDYSEIVLKYHEFLKKHPTFTESHRK